MKKQKKKDLKQNDFMQNFKNDLTSTKRKIRQNNENLFVRKNNRFDSRQNCGITLIALIISIIVLLILAGVSLSALVGDNGILTQATKAADQSTISSEEEAVELLLVSYEADKVKNSGETSQYEIGTKLYDKTLENGSNWKLIVENESSKKYGTGWNYIEKGTNIMDYGESKFAWLVNYETGEKVRLEDDSYTELDYSSSMAVTDGLIFNIDPTILEGYTEDELKDNSSILGNNVTLENFNWTEDSGLTSKSFNFDGVDDHINILYDNEENLKKLYENGLTFEYYGTIAEGSHVDWQGNEIERDMFGVFGLWNGNEQTQCKLRFGLTTLRKIRVSVLGSNEWNSLSPYCINDSPWNLLYPATCLFDNKEHYWIWSLNCSEIYNSSNTSDLAGYDGDFYSSKIFVDGKLLYDTYYSTKQYDYLKNNQSALNLKYFTIGRCTATQNGWWYYSKMKVYCMRLYNRGLNNEEMLENYNTTKAYYSAIIGN